MLPCALCGLAFVAALSNPAAESSFDGIHMDAVVKADLAGDGRVLQVEFYRRGPLGHSDPGQPPGYVRALAVRSVTATSAVLEKWESAQTSIPVFYPKLSNVWPVSEPGGCVITTAVQFGGRVMRLYAFRWQGSKLKQVGTWQAQDFSISQMDGNRHLVVVERSSDYGKVPVLYQWDGVEFTEASRNFPEFFSRLGASYEKGVRSAQPLPPAALVQNCRLALQAFQIAGRPQAGRRACVQARERISSGRAIISGNSQESPKEFENEKKMAIAEINKLIEESKQNSSTAQQP